MVEFQQRNLNSRRTDPRMDSAVTRRRGAKLTRYDLTGLPDVLPAEFPSVSSCSPKAQAPLIQEPTTPT